MSSATDSGFFAKVYALVALIPPGKVMTYGQISAALQSPYSAKLVGFAMSAAPPKRELPCHRVINRLGEMSPAFTLGGKNIQREKLEAESTPFLPCGRVNLELARFIPSHEQLDEIG